MNQNNKTKESNYFIYAILFVVILILIGISITYAFFDVTTSKPENIGGITAQTECLNISYNETDKIDLDYNYPVSDEYALKNIKPVIVTVKNNCTNNVEDLTYTLAITSLSNSTGFISDDKIRVNIKKTAANESETTLKDTDYLSNLTALTAGKAYTYLNNDLNSRASTSAYTNRSSYIIDNVNIANGITNTYKVYLWVDYYEGDTTHTGKNDNTTQGLNFSAAISLVVNP